MKNKIFLILMLISGIANAKMDIAEHKNNFFLEPEIKGRIIKMKSTYKDIEFTYYSYLNKDINRGKNNLYIVLHGESSNATDFFEVTKLHTELKKNSFIAINSPLDDWYSNEDSKSISLSFISELIKEYDDILRLNNIYVIGYSSGGVLANELLCNDLNISGVVNISGTINYKSIKGCNIGKNKIKYLHSVGTDDDYYGYRDKNHVKNIYKVYNKDMETLEKSQESISKMLGCYSSININLGDNDIGDYSNIIKKDFICKENSGNIYQVLKVEGMGHNWYNNKSTNTNTYRGNTNKDINISKYIFNFFNK